MMSRKQPIKKDDDHHDDQKNAKKKGKAVIPGGIVGTGQDQPSSDSGDPELDIDRAMQMTARKLPHPTRNGRRSRSLCPEDQLMP